MENVLKVNVWNIRRNGFVIGIVRMFYENRYNCEFCFLDVVDVGFCRVLVF